MPKEEKGYWFSTENGTHIHAEEGESKESAMKKKFSKFGKKEEGKGNNDYTSIAKKLNKEHSLSEEQGFKVIKTDDPAFSGVNIQHPNGKRFTPNELEYVKEHGTLKGYEELAKKREEAMRKGTFEEINAKRMGTDKGYDPSNRDESTKNHNKIIDSINARYSNNRISKEEYWKQIDEEVDRWNEEQEKHWKDDRPEFAKKIDEESKPAFDSAKKLDSLYKNAKEKNLDFERSLLNDIKSNPEAYNKIVLDNKKYVRNGNGFDFYENGKHIAFGTYNSVARDISNYYEDVESMLSKVDETKKLKEFDKLEKKVDKYSLKHKAEPIKKEIKQYMAGAKNGTITKEKTISQMEDRIKYLQRSNLLDTNPLRDPLLEYYQKAIEIVKSY